MKNKYFYSGPVTSFGRVLMDRWDAATYAVSLAKAKSNLTYQYKIKNNLLPGSKIELPGKIELVEEG